MVGVKPSVDQSPIPQVDGNSEDCQHAMKCFDLDEDPDGAGEVEAEKNDEDMKDLRSEIEG